ncbi:MAG: transcription initiation factor IIB, partial [Thermoprotei archaeon]
MRGEVGKRGSASHEVPDPPADELECLIEEMQVISKCPQCGGEELIKDAERGEIICLNCGWVIADHVVDQGPEWRAFNEEQRLRRARAGSPLSPLKPNRGLSTMIDWRNKDVSGKFLSPEKRPQL